MNSSCTPSGSGQQAEIGKIIDKYTLQEDVEKQQQEQKQALVQFRFIGIRGGYPHPNPTPFLDKKHNPNPKFKLWIRIVNSYNFFNIKKNIFSQ